MSKVEEGKASGFLIAEKFFGLVILILGALTIYYTNTSLSEIMSDVGSRIALFVQVFINGVGVGLIALGIILILAKTS